MVSRVRPTALLSIANGGLAARPCAATGPSAALEGPWRAWSAWLADSASDPQRVSRSRFSNLALGAAHHYRRWSSSAGTWRPGALRLAQARIRLGVHTIFMLILYPDIRSNMALVLIMSAKEKTTKTTTSIIHREEPPAACQTPLAPQAR